MPGYRTHQLAGAGLVFVMFVMNQSMHFIRFFSLGFYEFVIVALVTLFYSIFPDIDIGSSKPRKYVLGGGLLLIIYCFITGWSALGIVASVMMLLMIFMLQHRGVTHTALAGIIFSVPLIYLHWAYMLVGLVAYLSHLLIDGELKLR